MPSHRLFSAALLCASFSCALGVSAQNQTQGEKALADDIRDMHARREAAADNVRRAGNMAADADRRAADAAELQRFRATAATRTAENTASSNAMNAAIKARDNQLEAILADSMMEAHRLAKLDQLEDLRDNPPAAAVPGSYTECDELGSAPFDSTRPLGITGVIHTEMKTGAAIASCREELEKHPDSVRTSFELARALIYAGRCDEGIPALKQALALGSAAAAVSYALLPFGECRAAAGPVDREKYLSLASEMGSGDGAWLLGKYYVELVLKLPDDTPEWRALWNKEKQANLRAVKLLSPRADKGDLDALYIEADIAHSTGSEIFGNRQIKIQYRCVVRGYAPCQQFDLTR